MTHNTSSFTVCNTVRDFWAETVAYVEHLILKIGHYTVEQSLLTGGNLKIVELFNFKKSV